MPFEPAQAIAARHAQFDERPAVHLPGLEGHFHAHDFVQGDTDPLFNDGAARRAFAREPDQLTHLAADRHDLQFLGALPADHADLARCGFGEGGDRGPALALRAADQPVADVAGSHDMHWERQDIRRFKPGEMLIDGLRLPAGVGEDGAVGHRSDLAVGGHKGQGGRLHTGAERKRSEPDGGDVGRRGKQRVHGCPPTCCRRRHSAGGSKVPSQMPRRRNRAVPSSLV